MPVLFSMKCFRCYVPIKSVYVINVSEQKCRAEMFRRNYVPIKSVYVINVSEQKCRAEMFRRNLEILPTSTALPTSKTCVTRGIDGRHAHARACRPSISTTNIAFPTRLSRFCTPYLGSSCGKTGIPEGNRFQSLLSAHCLRE